MTQLLAARAGEITPEMERVARQEGVDPAFIRDGVAAGTIVIPKNRLRKDLKPCAIGRGLRTKVNALIGTSSDRDDPEMEARKIEVAVAAGADAIMDLSTGGDIDGMRRLSLERSAVPVGSVPIYQAGIEAIEKRGGIVAMTPEDMFAAIERQAAAGIDFMAIHCALNFEVVERLQMTGRVTDIVSRGGAFLTGWMLHNKRENPLYEDFDRVCDILREYDVVLSLGDAIRPGCIADSLDAAQVQGLLVAGELVARAREKGVQVMVEGPGHVPIHHVETTMLLQKQLCHRAPYFVLGTLATDVAPGYDHITAAIGGALAGASGADFICYVTPAEHLGLPTEEDVRTGVMAARIAAHAADIAKGVQGAREWDLQMARARASLDRRAVADLALDPAVVRCYHQGAGEELCRRCGDLCALRLVAEYFQQ
ncbi:B12 lower ligand biosynthesis ThiC-like protein BzaB [Desulfofundulus thermobenzoicus]|uniref:Phosphomethylpyrimidine synthase n=1 Tax=Desulfofundulus thermobenzoicus TaxID=29376 RepID=A0A6N7IVW3_9FIRM|nr:B12 lower ligand biosynthesis ThiC-like protein BzaB [Desulfofundulus thermobenzoicus]MQL53733.1 B12 lower ligand biosynthesis ThiC-like protein BzaB [Desulfofundulus thermobenzoicus]HHW43856.1 B12 lower ligand biosynthesis ThiC-like protein BzaB [Desulfotomaculum sp.]